MAEDPRTFKKYKVIGSADIRDGRTGENVLPGGVVELTEESRTVMIRQPTGLEPFEMGGTNINALLYAGFIEEIPEDAPPAKTGKQA